MIIGMREAAKRVFPALNLRSRVWVRVECALDEVVGIPKGGKLRGNPLFRTVVAVAISGPAQQNVNFYSDVLGQRLVKRTVNFNDPGTYQLHYGDGAGSPGTILGYDVLEQTPDPKESATCSTRSLVSGDGQSAANHGAEFART